MKTKHTPGPWKLNGDNKLSREYSNIIQSKEGSICHIYSMLDGKNNETKWKEMEANAKLIAAAPELLEALIKSNEVIAAFNLHHTILTDNTTVIKKATA